MTIGEAIEYFLADHRRLGSRPDTIRWYRATLGLLLRDRLGEPVTALTKPLMVKVLDRNVSTNTKAIYERALRGFTRALYRDGIIPRFPFEGMKRPREEYRPKKTLTQEEINRLFAAAGSDPRYRLRNRAMLYVLLQAGLRASEVARMRVEDVDWENAAIIVRGKAGDAFVPMSRDVYRAMKAYLTTERKGQSRYFFATGSLAVTGASVSRWVQRLAKRAGLSRPVGAHLLRHTFATNYLRAGGDAFRLQRLMRHKTAAMTQRYVNLVLDDVAADLNRRVLRPERRG
jgi:site-specific recombinase XerD